eukprot:gene7906-9391_t
MSNHDTSSRVIPLEGRVAAEPAREARQAQKRRYVDGPGETAVPGHEEVFDVDSPGEPVVPVDEDVCDEKHIVPVERYVCSPSYMSSPMYTDSQIPSRYPLWKVGDFVPMIGGYYREITPDMISLLGEADNTLAQIPYRLQEGARHVIANLVLSNMAIMPWQTRLETVYSEDDDNWVKSCLVDWNRQYPEHLLLAPEQSGKSGETAMICAYFFLVCGCAPLVSVRTHGGRKGEGGVGMEKSLNGIVSSQTGYLDGTASPKGCVVTLGNILDHVHELGVAGGINGRDRGYFYLQAALKEPGKVGIVCRKGNDCNEMGIPIILQNTPNIRHVNNLCEFLCNNYGAFKVGDKYKARLAFINDENDINFSGGGDETNLIQKEMKKVRQECMFNVSITATANTILMDTIPYIYIRRSHPNNYYGIANERVQWKLLETLKEKETEERKAQNERGEEVKEEIFPPFGKTWTQTLTGKSQCSKEYESLELTKRAYLDMVNFPDRVLDGWRHAAIRVVRAGSQQALAIYFASLKKSKEVFTMEWHSTLTTTDEYVIYRSGREHAGVRIWVCAQEWLEKICPIWNVLYPGLKWERYTVDRLAKDQVLDHKSKSEHHDVVLVELPDAEQTRLRAAITAVSKLWRPDGDLSGPPNRKVRLLVFSGEMNGRQVPNKADDNSTVLTDICYRVHIGDNTMKSSVAAATASQQISRVCGITHHVLSSDPIIWSTKKTSQYILNHHQLQRELCQLQAELEASERQMQNTDSAFNDRRKYVSLHKYLTDNIQRRERFPVLAQLRDFVIKETRQQQEKESKKSNLSPGSKKPRLPRVSQISVGRTTGPAQTLGAMEMLSGVGAAFPVDVQDVVARSPMYDLEAEYEAPMDTEEAARYIEVNIALRKKHALQDIKRIARGVFFRNEERTESGHHRALACVLDFFKRHRTTTGSGLPDLCQLRSIVSVDDLDNVILLDTRTDTESQIRALFSQTDIQSVYQERLGMSLFVHADGGWRMQQEVADKIHELEKACADITVPHKIRKLWKADASEAKSAKVIRSILRTSLSTFFEQRGTIVKPEEQKLSLVPHITISQLEDLLFRSELRKESWKLFCVKSRVWDVPVLERIGESEELKIHTEMLKQLQRVPELTLTPGSEFSLYRDELLEGVTQPQFAQ